MKKLIFSLFMLGFFLYLLILVFKDEAKLKTATQSSESLLAKLNLTNLSTADSSLNQPSSLQSSLAKTNLKSDLLPLVSLTPVPKKKLLTPFTHAYQKMNNCGPASLAIVASYYQVNFDQFQAAAVVKGSDKDKNVRPDELVAYLKQQGLTAIYRVGGTTANIEQLLANGIPVIVHQWLAKPDGELVGHYRVITGFDQDQARFYSSDSFTGPNFSLTYEEFNQWWRPFNYGYIPVYRSDNENLVKTILAANWDEQNNFQQALTRSQEDWQKNPDAYSYFNLGTNYLNVGDLAQAKQAYDQALSFTFPHYFLWYQFGPMEVYLRSGDYDKVISNADNLLANAGEVEEARLYKALVYLNQGHRELAKEEIKQALAANPRYQRAQTILQEL